MKIQSTKACTSYLKKQKHLSLKKNPQQLSVFLKSQGCNKEQLSLQCCEKRTSQIDLLCSSINRFCCRGRIGIKYLLSCLLQNNLLGVKMLFEIQKPQIFYSKQHFDTEEVNLQQKRKMCFISYVEYRGTIVQDVLMLMC